ncbi:MAG TPA: 50S ribosomal protein L23 [Candidatus Saccharimonadia bacterium]|jgi:large subunit ribosomal protein L23|nr:50S ribosomal protein L23 [Candidatus Saccharimonadia bacterium]
MSQLTLTPKISEKAIYLAERGLYVFEVPAGANKIEVAKAVEAQFKVNVTDVNITIAKGKLKRFKQILGRQKDVKKAVVKLKGDQKINLFEGAK